MTLSLALTLVVATTPSSPSSMGTVEGKVTFASKSLVGTTEVKEAEAIVFIERIDGETPKPPKEAPKMVQRNKAFEPRLLVVTAGSAVEFPNEDVIFHNVFSLSQGNQFDLGVYRQGTSKKVRFQQPGVVDVFCNIHPEMIASVLVLQNGHHAKVAKDGTFSLQVPEGKHTLVIYWSQGVLEKKEIEVAAGGKVTESFQLVDTGKRARHLNKHGQQYGRYK